MEDAQGKRILNARMQYFFYRVGTEPFLLYMKSEMISQLIDFMLANHIESLSLNSVPVYNSELINWGTH